MTMTMIAFAPKGTRLTAQGANHKDCRNRLRQLCRDYRLPMRRTLTTARVIPNPLAEWEVKRGM